jgi:outer membrane lipoprotein-sorting protein
MSLKGAELEFILKSLVAVIVLAFVHISVVHASEDVLNDLIERQSTLDSVRATFVQEKYDPLLGRPIVSEGDFYFKTGAGVRWEYEDVLVVYDGSVLYVYSPDMKEAEKINGEQGFMGPLAFDIKVLSEQYELNATRDGDKAKLDLMPRKDMPFQSMSMVFNGDSAFPSEVVITETTGDTSTIKFDKVRINKKVSDSLFVFDPPPGTTINERTFE